ncbi:MAG: chemotaxis response regulator protein-glutamate methylesterase [Janthinobacterium lividum]
MKIGIANDMSLAVQALRRVLAARSDYQVSWVAQDGREAIDFCRADCPDLVLMDLIMPNVDGVEATRQIMAHSPCAILIVTADVGAQASRVFDAMGAGALDAVDTPYLGADANDALCALALLEKIDRLGGMVRDERGSASRQAPLPTPSRRQATGAAPLLAIGASAGGPTAIATLLAGLPTDFAGPIVIVQHVDMAFAAGMADWLDSRSAVRVRVAREGEALESGVALLAATNDHLRFIDDKILGYTASPEDALYRPSVDVLFRSIVTHWRGRAIGVLLTGMGRDGAEGLRAMRDKGFYTIAQDAATSAVYGMPKAAAALDAAVSILPLDSIAVDITRHL